MVTEPEHGGMAAPEAHENSQPEPMHLRICLGAFALVAGSWFLGNHLSEWQATTNSRFSIFPHLFVRHDYPVALLYMVIILCGGLGIRCLSVAWIDRSMEWLGNHLRFVSLFTMVICAIGSVTAFQAYPLCMDEYSPVFQAEVFASGRLWAEYPPEWIEWLFPLDTRTFFIVASPETGRAASWYWPGFALLLTPFTWLGVPWLLNPILTGITVGLIGDTAKAMTGSRSASGWAMLLALASPVLLINGMSFYSMPAHLVANVLFARLLIQPTPWRLYFAGLVGSVALVLHNPLPHTAFALPWLMAIVWRSGRVRNTLWISLGYLPLLILLGGGWLYVRSLIATPATVGNGSAEGLLDYITLAFRTPDQAILYARAIGLAKMVLWSAPLVIPLAWVGWRVGRRLPGVNLWAASALLTLLVFLPVHFDQGHGWGYRYFHSAWAVFPILGAIVLHAPLGQIMDPSGNLFRAVLVTSLMSLLVVTPLRMHQVHDFIAQHRAQAPQYDANAPGWPVIFQDTDSTRTYYGNDLVQNEVNLRRPPLMLVSHGSEANREFILKLDPAARQECADEHSSLWRLSHKSPSQILQRETAP